MRVLGIDPGTSVTGWGVVEATPGDPRWVASGVIRLSACLDHPGRLRRIHDAVSELIREHEPQELSLEKAFVSRNVQSALRLGEARGAVLIAAAESGLAVFEYSPAEVKQSVVGYGQAQKEQITRGVTWLLSIGPVSLADEADALAVALCHLRGRRLRALAGRLR
jgi:crossover junction endodeoxyribonuclease RuvC